MTTRFIIVISRQSQLVKELICHSQENIAVGLPLIELVHLLQNIASFLFQRAFSISINYLYPSF